MKRILYFLLVYCLSLTISAQEISVKSFRQLPNNVIINPVKNDNAQTCALVKIVTTERGFAFDPDGLGICGNVDESHDGEIWLWLPPGARRITIRHKDLGVLRDYEYPVAIESASTYEMVLVTAKIYSHVEEQSRENWLALKVEPEDATVKIDGKLIILKHGENSRLLSLGEHEIECFCPLYHPEKRKFNIVADKTTQLDITLKPNYGFLEIVSTPENGATVFLNAKRMGTTPYKSDKLESGKYTVQLAQEMFQDVQEEVEIIDGQTKSLTLIMKPDYAMPTFRCADKDAEIWLNGEKKGVGQWTGRLMAGSYRVEAKKESYRPVAKSISLNSDDRQEIVLEAPTPIYGKINLSSIPMEADIYIDGKYCGETPKLFEQILVGTHDIHLKKEGFEDVKKTVQVYSGQTEMVNEKLPLAKKEEPIPVVQTIEEEPVKTVEEASFSASDETHCKGVVSDYDGNQYNMIQMGAQCWLKENMRATHAADGTIIPQSSSTSYTSQYRYAPNNSNSNVASYGYLYNYAAAVKVCPKGWHLPTKTDFEELKDYCSQHYALGGNYTYVGKALAAMSGWKYDKGSYTVGNKPVNNDVSGFSAMPAGYYTDDCVYFGLTTTLLSSTQYDSDNAYGLDINFNEATALLKNNNVRRYGFSVRCVRDGNVNNTANAVINQDDSQMNIVQKKPSVTTNPINSITSFSAKAGGKISSEGGADIIACGVCWSTSPYPTIDDMAGNSTCNALSLYMQNKAKMFAEATDFTCNMLQLAEGTTYYVRAYATNSVGTAYGNQITFTTTIPFVCGSSTMSDYDGNKYNTVKIGNQCWMKENMQTTHDGNGKLITQTNGSGFYSPVYYTPNSTTAYLNPKIGYWYNWYAAQTVCPKGWHLPTQADMEDLVAYCSQHYSLGGDTRYIAKSLASTSSWEKSLATRIGGGLGSGTYSYSIAYSPESNNKTGFSLRAAGVIVNGNINGLGKEGSIWTSATQGATSAYVLRLVYDEAQPFYVGKEKSYGLSVRCVKD